MISLNRDKSEKMKIEDTAALAQALADQAHSFSREELEGIIQNEFFNDDNPLDIDIVDAALARLMLLDGIPLNEETLQRQREEMIYGVFKKILKPRK